MSHAKTSLFNLSDHTARDAELGAVQRKKPGERGWVAEKKLHKPSDGAWKRSALSSADLRRAVTLVPGSSGSANTFLVFSALTLQAGFLIEN